LQFAIEQAHAATALQIENRKSKIANAMTPALLGKKIGTTRIYDDKGSIVPVTVVQAGPCAVTQVKTIDTDGYYAVQLGFGDAKPRHSTMPLIGHAAKAGVAPKRHFREIRLKDATDKKPGDTVNVELFTDVQFVDVIGTSKGKGTAGVMKRHHFGGQCASHGTERKHRSPGSLASRATWRGQSGKPKKGVRMAGHMGMDQVTTRNHPLVKIDSENNLLLIKGALPGPNGGLLFVRKATTARVREEAK
jgi:large subunit ribosomal protein L3